jgi:hypothetical protein
MFDGVVATCIAQAGVMDASGTVLTMDALTRLLDDMLKREYVKRAWISGSKLMVELDMMVDLDSVKLGQKSSMGSSKRSGVD